MSESAPVDDQLDSLEVIIETHLQRLTEKLAQSSSLDELANEVNSLNDFLSSYKSRDEMLERLVEISTPEKRRQEIRQALQAQKMLVAANLAESQRLHAKSQELLQRSARIIIRARRHIDKEAHRHTGYDLELCGFCKGVGGTFEHPCPACQGRRFALVHQPSIKCPRCDGNGQPNKQDYHQTCLVCRGTGWVMTS